MRLSAAVFVTRADRTNFKVKKGIETMFERLNELIEWREARIFKRDEGLLIVILITERAKLTMLKCTQRIEELYDDERSLFYDAELG